MIGDSGIKIMVGSLSIEYLLGSLFVSGLTLLLLMWDYD